MPNSGVREIIESTSSRKTGHQVEGWSWHPTVKNYDPDFLLSKRTRGIKMGRDRSKGIPVTVPTWDPSQGEVPRSATITDAI